MLAQRLTLLAQRLPLLVQRLPLPVQRLPLLVQLHVAGSLMVVSGHSCLSVLLANTFVASAVGQPVCRLCCWPTSGDALEGRSTSQLLVNCYGTLIHEG
jgi:hypothetical protein